MTLYDFPHLSPKVDMLIFNKTETSLEKFYFPPTKLYASVHMQPYYSCFQL